MWVFNGWMESVGTVTENDREIAEMTQEAETVTHHVRLPGVPPSTATMAHLRSSNLSGRHAAEFSDATHGSWCRAVPPTNLVVVVAGAGGSCCHDGPVVCVAS